MFSKKSTKKYEIFTVDLMFILSVKSMMKIYQVFVAFLKNVNFIVKTEVTLDFILKVSNYWYLKLIGNYQKYIDLGLLSGSAIRPTGMNRQQTHSDFEPTWETDAETVIFEIAHQLDAGELSLSYSTYDSFHKSRADTDMTVGPRVGCVVAADGTVGVNDGSSCLSAAQNATAGNVIMYDLVVGGQRGVYGPTIAEENYGGSMTSFTGIYQQKYILLLK